MNTQDTREEELLAELHEIYCRHATGTRISRRSLLRSSAGTGVVTAVGMGGLLELLANREAFAAGNVIAIVGVTRNQTGGTPHRHTFSVRFQVTEVTETDITGNVFGRTEAVISTGDEKEEQHWHLIQSTVPVALGTFVLSGTENEEPMQHRHQVSIE
jgi:hypothetical protein